MVYVLYCVKRPPPLFILFVISMGPTEYFDCTGSFSEIIGPLSDIFYCVSLSLMRCLGLYVYKSLMTGLLALFVKAYAGLT